MKPDNVKRAALAQTLGGIFTVVCSGAWGQAVQPDAGQLMGTLKDPIQTAPQKSPTLNIQQEARPALNATSSIKVVVKKFRISGNSAFSEEELAPLLQGLVGKELGLQALDNAASEISKHYRKNGFFVARAYLPAQEIKDGIVEIAVIEGRLGKVVLKRDVAARLSEEKAQQILAAASAPGQAINEKNLERGLLLLNDLPGVDVKSTLVPGATPGTSDLVVEAKEGDVLGGSADIDNYGNKYSGKTRLGASVNISDPTGFGDQISLRGMSSGSGMSYVRGSYMVPVGSSGAKLGLAASGMQYKLRGDFAAIRPEGEAAVYSVFGLHPFVRSRNFNLYGALGYDAKAIKDDTLGVNRKNKRIDAVNLGVSGDARDGLGGGGLWSYGATYVGGRLNLSRNAADLAADQAAAGEHTHGNYGKLSFNLARLQRLTDDTSLYAAFSGQFASKNLDSSEKFTLGGLGVRAYPQGEAPGDEGYLLNAEARFDFPGFSELGNLQFIGFIDSGWVKLHRNTWVGWNAGRPGFPNSYSLSGLGLGFNFYKSSDFSIRANYAWKLGSNPGRDVNNRDSDNTDDIGRLWLQAVKWF
ncbi:MAG TPA: ShlB/FhaC/HecB family hemolysin secretion/activation protein [Rhodocyclaceae bacterium]|nr:ShlB/FhaC/HecB family hemolysin secretion/activation protein [Rhodocyclaceae bacterium]